MTAVVTGAAGHIGVNLVRALRERGDRVRAVVHRRDGRFEGLGVEEVPGDVLDPASLRRAFAGAEVVYHLAAVISITGDRGGLVHRVNVDGAANVAEAALEAGADRLVHCSSIHAFDLDPGPEVLDESAPRIAPGSRRHPAYDLSKADGERGVRAVMDRGLDAVVVHPTSVLGPADLEPSRLGRVLLRVRDRRLRLMVAGGFDFVDVRDVAGGLMAAADRGAAGSSYLLGGRYATIAELVGIAAAAAGVRPPRVAVPKGLARLGTPFATAAGWVRRSEPLYTAESLRALRLTSRVDWSAAAADLGYRPRPLEDSVADLYRWFAGEGM